MGTRHKYILFLLLFSFFQNSICQKDTTIIKKYLGQTGVIVDTKNRWGIHLGLNYNLNKNVFTVRYYQNEEVFVGFPFKMPSINYIQKIQNISFMYGICFGNKYFKCIPMAGFSAGQGNWRNNLVDTVVTKTGGSGWFGTTKTSYVYHYDKFQYIGLHLNLNLLWTPTKYFGVGLNVFENFHFHSDNGIVVSIVFGNLR
jgi:hypothetical protein